MTGLEEHLSEIRPNGDLFFFFFFFSVFLFNFIELVEFGYQILEKIQMFSLDGRSLGYRLLRFQCA
ncbi:hypothetical protein CFP56_016747 [Quercus suber]|uniref:Uncharacterized protein n=1 Tax=Quercus suber TaxID=58331 RepID=A0AAW0KMG3_QUESU